MPTLVVELTPLQRMWLYENQRTSSGGSGGGSGSGSGGDGGNRQQWPMHPVMDTTIFRSRTSPMDQQAEGENASAQLGTKEMVTAHKRKREDNTPPPPLCRPKPVFPHVADKLTWDQSFDNLKVYKDMHGDCNVPQKFRDNPKLGGWVNKQRKKKKNPMKYGRLSQEQIQRLDNLGFAWN